MKTYQVVMCHKAAKDTVLRHLPYWQAQGTPVMIFCPVDGAVQMDGCEHLYWGRCEHHGAHSIARFRFLINHLKDRCAAYDRVVIWEYDSICLSPELPETRSDAVTANAFYNRDDNARFKEKMFTHPPLFIPLNLMGKLCDAMKFVSNDDEGSFWDRWFGYVCDLAKVEIVSLCEHTKQGYSQNTIEREHEMTAVAASSRGVRVFHGVKTPEMLNVIRLASPWILHTGSRLKKVNYVAFSLYGDSEKYLNGMWRNLHLISQFYPGWSARIYMPPEMCGGEWHKQLATYVKFRPAGIPDMMSRFLIHDSPDCDRFLVRDADSRIGTREAAAVADWITSGRLLHIMRDHKSHGVEIPGGMWGGQGGKLVPNMLTAIRKWMQTKAGGYEGHDHDQRFLADVVYVGGKDSMMQHDTFYRRLFRGSMAFPTTRDCQESPRFVGEVFSANGTPRESDWDLIKDQVEEKS